MVSSTLLFLPLYLACLPSTTAWVFSWTNSTGGFLIDHGDGVQACKAMDNPEGNIYDWDPKGGNFCIYLYNNDKCTDPSAGYTCKPWPWDNHKAGSHIRSYEVVANYTSTTTSAGLTSTTALTSTQATSLATSTSASNASSPTTTPVGGSSKNSAGKDSSPSGGALAGIIVGVLAAVAIAGILLFFLCWRPRRKSGPSNTLQQPTAGMMELPDTGEQHTSLTSMKPLAYQGQKLGELPGSNVASEMGPGTVRMELDGSTQWKK